MNRVRPSNFKKQEMQNNNTTPDVTMKNMCNFIVFGCGSVVVDKDVPKDKVHAVYEKDELVEIRADAESIGKLKRFANKLIRRSLKR